MISGIIQTSIEPKSHKNNTPVEIKHFSNFYTRRLQQKYKASSKSPIITTTVTPVSHNKQTIPNRLASFKSKFRPTNKNHTIDHLSTLKVEKKAITSLEDDFTQKNVNNRSTMGRLPTWESVRKNLLRYQTPKNNFLQQFNNLNPKISSSRTDAVENYNEQNLIPKNNTKDSTLNFLEQNNKEKLNERFTQYSSTKSIIQNIVNNTSGIINNNDLYINLKGELLYEI